MLIALLAVLGVDLAVLVVLGAVLVSRRRWVRRQSGAFGGAIRVRSGAIDGLGPKWHRGYGRWVADVLVWDKAPFLFRNEIIAIDGVEDERAAEPDEIKRLGDHPAIATLRAHEATAEVAVHEADRALALGPYQPVGRVSSDRGDDDGQPRS